MSLNDRLHAFPAAFVTRASHESRGGIAGSHFESMNVSSAQFRRHGILCVDDDVIGTTARAKLLRDYGYSVHVYHSPFAVLRCDLSLFDLAILDFNMPGLNGRELLLRMRALGARFPMVLLTGCLDALSHDDRVLFARCIDKSMPVARLLGMIAEFFDPDQVPDYGP